MLGSPQVVKADKMKQKSKTMKPNQEGAIEEEKPI